MIVEGKLLSQDGSFIFYKQRKTINLSKPGVVYLAGYGSDLNCKKSKHVDQYCAENGLSCLRFDYSGHTYSSGNLVDATLSLWKQNFLDILDKLTTGPQIIVCSSMGCWVAILGALDRLNRIHSIISIASAVDTMYHRFKEFSEDEKNTIKQQGYWIGPKTGSVFGYNFLQSCIDNTLMTVKEKQIQIYCPVRILHGMSDDVVPYQVSLKLSKMISSNDIEVHLVKHFDHMMNSDEALALLSKVLDEMVKVGLDSDVNLQAPSKL